MALLSYRRHRFPPPIIQHAIWLYLRFTPSYRDVEDLLAERGLDVSYETETGNIRGLGARFSPKLLGLLLGFFRLGEGNNSCAGRATGERGLNHAACSSVRTSVGPLYLERIRLR